jgi:hypothetical protein
VWPNLAQATPRMVAEGRAAVVERGQESERLDQTKNTMQAGRWKSNRMPTRYGEHVLAARGGMARAAQAQGRESK